MTAPINVIVTGANRGIGQAICKFLLSKQEASPLRLFATTRNGDDLGLEYASQSIVYPKLDISSHESIQTFVNDVGREGKVDVLINNAGVNLDSQNNFDGAKKTLDVNYRGTLKMCQTFIPLLSSKGRIVNLSSIASAFKPYSEQIIKRFRNPDLTLVELEQLAQEYEQAIQSNSTEKSGFAGPDRAYAFSKACVNALTHILARDNPGLEINACCPGWVRTDMGLSIGRAPKTPEEGARIPVRLALGDTEGVTGKYWANSSIRSREEGQVMEW